MAERGEGYVPPKENKKERSQYEVAEKAINVAETISNDVHEYISDFVGANIAETDEKQWAQKRYFFPGELFVRMSKIIGLGEGMRSYAVDTLSGKQWSEGDNQYGDDKLESISELIESKGGERAIKNELYTLSVEVGQIIKDLIAFVPETNRTPEMFQKALEIPVKLFEQSTKLLD